MSRYNSRAIQIGRMATFATLAEALSAPSPGLVNRFDNGSHRDMNIFTFAASSTLLMNYFMEAVEQGLIWRWNRVGYDSQEVYSAFYLYLNQLGRAAEKEIWEMIGVNTHKGVIYLLLLLCGAAGLCFQEKASIEITDVCYLAGAIARPEIELEFADARGMRREKLSTGLRVFLDFGFQGIRGEVKSNFRLCREVGVSTLNQTLEMGATLNDALVHCLFMLMIENEDTTLLNRSYQLGNVTMVRTWARKVVAAGSVFTEEGRKWIKEFQKIMLLKQLSPGGSADLVSVSLFLWLVNQLQEGADGFRQLLARDNTGASILSNLSG